MAHRIWGGWRPTRREALVGAGALALAGSARFARAQNVAPITIVINQSPWFESFSKTVALYQEETGNQVELDVNPFAGSLEKQRNSVRAGQGDYDILIMNSGWFAEMYAGGFVTPITDIDPGFAARSRDLHARRYRVLRRGQQDDDAGRQVDVDADFPAHSDPLLSRGPVQGSRPERAGDLCRSGSECAQVPQSARHVRDRAARGARPAHRRL